MRDDMMEECVSKTELLQRLACEYARFNAVLTRLSDAQMILPNVIGSWSIKDLLAHLIAHEQRALDELRHALRDERLVIDHAANDAFNAHAVTASREQSLAEVRATWEVSHRQAVAAVQNLPDADFDPLGNVAQALDDTIDGALGNNTYGHYAEHLVEIEAWLQSHE